MTEVRAPLSRDGWAGLAVLVFSSVLFSLSFQLPEMPLVPVGPGFYPRIVLGFTAVLGLWLLIADGFRANRLKAPQPAVLAGRYRSVAVHFALFAVYVALLAPIGFRISTLAYVAASSYLLQPPKSYKGWLRILILSLVAAFVMFFIFERYLAVLLPRGRWTSF